MAEIRSPVITPNPARARSEWAIAGALFLVGLGLAGVLALLWLHVEDDGLYMYQANLVLHGGLPYRDFLLQDGPLGSAWHALLLALFGNDVLVLRLGVLPFKALLLPAVYALSRPLVPRGPAVLAALIVPIVDTNLSYTVAHIALNALGCGVAAVVLLAVWLRQPHPRWLVAAGALLGIMADFKQNMGLFLLGGAVLWLLAPDLTLPGTAAGPAGLAIGTREQRAAFALRAGAWGLALLCTLWLVRPHLEPGVLGSLVAPIIVLAGAALYPHRSQGTTGLRPVLNRLLPLLAGFVAAALPPLAWAVAGAGLPAVIDGLLVGPAQLGDTWFAPLRDPSADFWWLLGVCASGVALSGATLALTRRAGRWGPLLTWGSLTAWGVGLLALTPLAAYAGAGLPYVWLYCNILVFWPAFVLSRRLPPGPQRGHVQLLLLTSAFLALEMYPQMRRVYANWCFVLFLPLAAWALWTLARALGRLAPAAARGRIGAAPGVALLLLPLLAGWWILDWRLNVGVDVPASLRAGRVVPPGLAPLDLPHFHVWETPEHRTLYRQVADSITRLTTPGEPIYCFYRQTTFYVATERPAAARLVYPPPGTNLADGLALRDELDRAGVRVVLAENTAFLPEGPVDVLFPGRVATWAVPVRDYLTNEFQQVEVAGDWSLWTRR